MEKGQGPAGASRWVRRLPGQRTAFGVAPGGSHWPAGSGIGGPADRRIRGGLKQQPAAAITVVVPGDLPASVAPVSPNAGATSQPIITQVVTSAPSESGATPVEQLPATDEAAPTAGPSETPVPPSATPTPSATATFTATPTRRPPTPTLEPGLIADFERFGTWKRGDQPERTFTQSAAQVHQGSYAGN